MCSSDLDLGHVAHQRHNLSLRNVAIVHADRSYPYQNDDRSVDDNIGKRIHERRDLADIELDLCQRLIVFVELCNLCLLYTSQDT